MRLEASIILEALHFQESVAIKHKRMLNKIEKYLFKITNNYKCD